MANTLTSAAHLTIPLTLMRFAKPYYNKHDDSHGWLHIKRVLANVRKIQLVEMPDIRPHQEVKLIYATVLHDIADHKYVATQEEKLNLQINIFAFLVNDIGLVDAGIVFSLASCISFSRRQEIDADIQRDTSFWIPEHCLLLNIIRDADMIDAINIRRSYRFHTEWRHESPTEAKMRVCEYWNSTLKTMPTKMHFHISSHLAQEVVAHELLYLPEFLATSSI